MVTSPLAKVNPLAFFLLLSGLLASLASATPVEMTSPASEGEATATQPGLRIYLDPETGAWRSTPTPEQAAALSRSSEPGLASSSEGLETFALRRGGRGVFLQGRFQSALVVKVGDEGGLLFSCVDAPPLTPPAAGGEAASNGIPEEK